MEERDIFMRNSLQRAAIITRANFDSLPLDRKLSDAWRGWTQRLRWSKATDFPKKPRVVVLKAQGRRLIVLRGGRWFVAGFTWEAVIRKAAIGPWKKLEGTTLEKRLP